jgi:osmotically-inducible protein OsmY
MPDESDNRLRKALIRRLAQELGGEAARIGVAVRDGAVTLTGRVSSEEARRAAVDTARHVPGVRALADELEVVWAQPAKRDDAVVAEAVALALRSSRDVPDSVYAEVRGRFVTLRGEVRWTYERTAAERAVGAIPGVLGILNEIAVEPLAIGSILYDEDDRPTGDPARAVRGEVVERDADGSVVGSFDDLAWVVDPKALDGDLGELATRPRRSA